MKILTFTTLYPDATRPGHGIFVENRLRHLVADGTVQSRVVAPVPWFPSTQPRFGEYADYARVPAAEVRHGIPVLHPRYLLLPKVGMTLAPYLMARAVQGVVRSILESGYAFDLIDAHYFYPDGVAAVMIGKALGKPVVITARGTDLNLIPQYALPRRMIRWAAANSAAMITVCQALKDVLLDLGVADSRVTALRNGVDLEVFRPPTDREALRARLGIHGPTLLSVGYLIERKGHHLVIDALQRLPGVKLLIAGDGPERARLLEQVAQAGVADRVTLLGRLDTRQLADHYGAADALVLASSREGWANVLLESMACGTPVVATRIWGTPEVVGDDSAGELVDERTAQSLAHGVQTLLARAPDRAATRRYAEGFSWDATTAGQKALFERVLARAG
jgi:teichuronic acid biosynthesis glycosyltransferase TuaC